jgi:hypothetical protein
MPQIHFKDPVEAHVDQHGLHHLRVDYIDAKQIDSFLASARGFADSTEEGLSVRTSLNMPLFFVAIVLYSILCFLLFLM